MNGVWLLVGLLVLVAVVVFFALREFWTWYWKQSEQAELLKRIADSLERLEAAQGLVAPRGPAAQLPGYTAYTVRPRP